MAWIYRQNFDALNDGDLNGQDSWASTTAVDVQTTVKAQGAKAIAWLNNTDAIIARTITGVTSGAVHVSMRSTVNNAAGCWFGLKGNSGANYCGIIQLAASGQIIMYTGATQVNLGAYSANTWYDVIVEFNCTTDQYRVSINNGASWSNWYVFWDTSNLTSVDKILLGSNNNSAAGTSYIDDIRPHTEVKTFNGLAFSGIKTIHGLAIGSVKNINGLA